MKNNYQILCSLFLVVLLGAKISIINGQSLSDKKDYYKWFDTVIKNENTDLYNGTVFINRYRTVGEKHRFFKVEKFLTGIVTYGCQPYYDLPIQYDIYQDQLIVNLKLGYGEVALQLIKDQVEGFVIDQTEFVNISNDSLSKLGEGGFYEVLLDGSILTLFKKHKKSIRKRIRNGKAFYEYPSSYNFLLFYNKNYWIVKRKKEVIEIFPMFRKEINNYYETYGKLLKSNPDSFRKSLFERIQTLISNTN